MKEHYSMNSKPVSIRNITKITKGFVDKDKILKKYPQLIREKMKK